MFTTVSTKIVMGLLIWKIIGYGVVFAFIGGIAISALSAVGTILFYTVYPIFIVGFLVLSVITHPLTAFIQSIGYKCPSLFSLWLKMLENKSRYERLYQSNANGHSKVNQPNEDEPKATSFDPWTVLEIPRNATKQEISTAYKKKLTLNHPDKVANLDPELQSFATQRTILLRKAYDQLVST